MSNPYIKDTNGLSQAIGKGYIKDSNGFSRKIKKAYMKRNGVSVECWSGLEIVSWATGTDEQIVAMVEAADRGEINLADYWTVGDTRRVRLSAMAATGVSESHSAQDVELVLMHAGGYQLNTPVASGRKTCSFIVGQKDCLATLGYMNATQSNLECWEDSKRRAWCNNVYKNAIPATLLPIFKQFKTVTASAWNTNNVETSIDTFAIPSQKEIYGNSATYVTDGEKNALSQFTWYKTSANIIKKQGISGSNAYEYWCRGPSKSGYEWYTCYNQYGSSTQYANYKIGISPFGCI